MFKQIQLNADDEDGSVSLKPLCPTRWICRGASLESVDTNYENILDTLEEIKENGGNSEGAKAAPGLIILMEKFATVFGLQMCQTFFMPIEELARELQSKDITASTVNRVKDGLIRFLHDLRRDEHFKKLFENAVNKAKELNIEGPSLPRQRKRRNIHSYFGNSNQDSAHGWSSPEEYFRAEYREVIDLLTASLNIKRGSNKNL